MLRSVSMVKFSAVYNVFKKRVKSAGYLRQKYLLFNNTISHFTKLANKPNFSHFFAAPKNTTFQQLKSLFQSGIFSFYTFSTGPTITTNLIKFNNFEIIKIKKGSIKL